MVSRGFSLTRMLAVVVAADLVSTAESDSPQSQQIRVAGITWPRVSTVRLIRALIGYVHDAA